MEPNRSKNPNYDQGRSNRISTPKTLTTEECEKLLTELKDWYNTSKQARKCIRNHTIALLMLDAGLRVGEVVQLRISDLYFNCQPVTSIIIRPEIAKNKTERTIPVSVRLSNALKKYCGDISKWKSDFDNPYAFAPHLTDLPLTTRQVERIIRAAAMKSLGRPIHPHILRHTFASKLMRVTDMRTVQELLGHANLSSTQVYTHPNSEDLKKAIDNLDNACQKVMDRLEGSTSTADTPNSLDTPGTDRDMG